MHAWEDRVCSLIINSLFIHTNHNIYLLVRWSFQALSMKVPSSRIDLVWQHRNVLARVIWPGPQRNYQ